MRYCPHNILTIILIALAALKIDCDMKQEGKSFSPPHKTASKSTNGGGYDKNKWGGGRSVVASTPAYKGALPNVGTFIAGTQQAA